jgi:hypothetical protein
MGKMSQMQNTFFSKLMTVLKRAEKWDSRSRFNTKKITMRTRRCSFRSRFHKKNHNANEKVQFCFDIQLLVHDDVLCSFYLKVSVEKSVKTTPEPEFLNV